MAGMEGPMKKKKLYSGLVGIVLMGSMAFPAYAVTGWVPEDGNWKYESPEGACVVNDWSYIDGQWYHFDEIGHMQTGWIKGTEGWYYLGEDGILWSGGEAVDSQGRTVQPFSGDGYFLDGDSYIFNPNTDYNMIFSSGNMNDTKVIAALKGIADASALNSREAAVYERCDTFLKSNIHSTDSNYEKARKIYEYIKEVAVYQDTGRMEDDCPYSILIDGVGVCGGFARTYKVLANGAGLECRYESDAGHAWNQVYTDSWKWIDVSAAGRTADFYLKSNRYHCDGCGWSGILPPRNYYTCPCGNTFGADK